MAKFINNSLYELPSRYLRNCTQNDTGGFMSCYAGYVNVVTSGMFWAMMLLAFGVVMFIYTIRYDPKKAFAFTGFIFIVGSILLVYTGLMTWWIASAFIVTGLISLGVVIYRE